MKFTPKRALGAAAVLALAIPLAACGGEEEKKASVGEEVSAGCVRPAEKTPIKIGAGSSIAYAHLYVAEEFGYFDDENLDIEFATIAKPSDTLPLVSQGEIDAAFGGLSAGFINAVDRGLDLRLVQARGEYPAGQEKAAAFMVRADLVESGKVKTVADLKGLTIGLAGGAADIGNSGGYFISRILGEEGLTLKDVKWSNVGQADTEKAFDSKSIDAAFLPSPFSTMIKDSGKGVVFGNQEMLSGETSGGLMYGPNLIEDDRVAGEALMRALLRASEVMREGDYRTNADVVKALEAHDYPAEVIERTPLYAYEEGLPLNPGTFETFQKTFLEHGDVLTTDEVTPFEDITDVKLAEAASKSFEACGYAKD